MMVWITCLWDSVEAKSEVLKTNIKWWFCITLIKKESLFYNTCCILCENFSVNMKPVFFSLSQRFFLYSTFFLSLFYITGCFLLDLIIFQPPLCLNPVMLLMCGWRYLQSLIIIYLCLSFASSDVADDIELLILFQWILHLWLWKQISFSWLFTKHKLPSLHFNMKIGSICKKKNHNN